MTYHQRQEQRILQATRCPVDGRVPASWDIAEDRIVFVCGCGEGVAAPVEQTLAILGGLPRLIPRRWNRDVVQYAGLIQLEAAHGVPYTHLPRGPSLEQAVGRAQVRVQMARREAGEIDLRMTQQEA